MIKQRLATKLGNKVITRFGQSELKKLNFPNEQEAIDFCERVAALDPDSPEDVDEYNSLVQAILDPEAVHAAQEIHKTELKSQRLRNINEIDSRLQYRDGSVYFKETGKISMPERVVDEIIDWYAEKRNLEPLFNFWRLAALNPNPEAREGLYRFITDLNLILTEEGLFVAYRNVAVVNETNFPLVNKVSQVWTKLLQEGKKPSEHFLFRIEGSYVDYNVDYEDEPEDCLLNDEYIVISKKRYSEVDNIIQVIIKMLPQYDDLEITNWELLGNVQEVYQEIISDDKQNVSYTDAHSRTMNISIGAPTNMRREDCDEDPKVSCSRGLHVGSKSFMSPNYFGNRGLVVLVNPRNVVCVPYEYGTGYKLRCCEYLPIAFAEYDDEGKLIELEGKSLSSIGLDYMTSDMENLRVLLENTEFEEAQNHKIVPKDLGWIDTKAVFNNIDGFLKKRTVILENQ